MKLFLQIIFVFFVFFFSAVGSIFFGMLSGERFNAKNQAFAENTGTEERVSSQSSWIKTNRYRSWGGYTYFYKEKGVWKARAVFAEDDPNFFCGGGLKKSILEKGVDLVPFTPEGCSQKCSKDTAAFHLPEIFGDMNYHKAIFLDSRGNVFFETQGFPEGQCSNLMVIGQRFSRLEGDEQSDNWLYVPYHLYGTTSRGDYTGVPCPE